MKNFWNYLQENFSFSLKNCIAIFLFLFLLFSQSCKKEINSIGLNFKDDLLKATFTDTTTLVAYSVKEDTLLNTTGLIYNFLGWLKDEVFGTTTACIYTQFIPEGNSLNAGNNPTLDSIVLTLRYSGDFYGDTLKPFIIKVYELKEDILPSNTYLQNSSIEYFPDNLTYVPEFRPIHTPNKSMMDTMEAHLRIRLQDELGKKILENTDKLQTPEKFKDFFKGLYICAEPYQNNGSMVNFTLTSALSGIQIYYNNGSEQKLFSLIINNQDAVRFNSYHHEYENGNSNFVKQVLQKDTTKGKEVLYLQSMGGIKTKISFPYLKKTFENKKIVINKAELVITNIGEKEELSLYPPPIRLGVQGLNASGITVVLPDDESFTSTSYWGGIYNEETNEYRFRITRYIQDIILRDNFKPYINLVVRGAAANANRLLVRGTNPLNPSDTASRLRLELFYTEY
ncbi:MAG: DUF4270 domain-containing protein [Bacteroidales bacterium]|jgi:hypothetical protein|nr:DUF4270 domain-containing protein [Bacteroidales bacterium]